MIDQVARQMADPAHLLREMAKNPCACNARPVGDRQELVGQIQVKQQTFMRCQIICVYASLRCLVCQDVHKAAMVAQEVLLD